MSRGLKPTVENPTWSDEYREAWRALPLCPKCGRKLRPLQRPLRDFPGTVSRGAKQMCQSCGASPAQRRAVKAERINLNATPKAVLASRWGHRQRHVALSICARFTADVAEELMSTLGLFEDPALNPYMQRDGATGRIHQF